MSIECRDRGSIVIGWLTKLVVVLSVVGVALFDVGSIAIARLNASDDANSAASAAEFDWRTNHSVQSAYQAAVGSLLSTDETVLTRGFSIDPDGTVHLLVRRVVPTLVAHRIGPLQKYVVVIAPGEATAPAP